MDLQLIRNATLKLRYGGLTILVDPYFADRHSLPSYTGRSPNPAVDLPMSIDAILSGVDLVIVSHLHSDHFDGVAKARLPKTTPILCQPGDEDQIRGAGFVDVTPLDDRVTRGKVRFHRRAGSHGLGAVLAEMGSVMGFSLSAEGEPSLYWAGDTVLYPPVADTIADLSPDVIVTHSCGALWNGDPIVMDAEETLAVCRSAPWAIVVATHLDTLDHATVSRQDLRAAADAAGVSPQRLVIPQDGETLRYSRL
ncbi:MBL fold metallo-hydrolase [Rhizobium sp. FKL33]|uniref:MBL fold metallo-hydrolase n=1 Tax=Rhizobium sp. FKL33 TaxID=2562307 RepID=UPI0010C0BAFF|nr:MBL fold metallo-hydrolase [Rhizobium sp. FKL33]